MSAPRGEEAQDTPATGHPKADVLSRPTILSRFNIASALFVGIKRTAFPQCFVVVQKQALAKIQCPRIPSF